MATARRFEELNAWRAARVLTGRIYRLSASGRLGRDFGLRDQMRRASVSVMSNIAEGFERRGDVEFARFLTIAKASAGETESHLYLALDLDYLTQHEFEDLRGHLRQTKSLIVSLLAYLKRSRSTPASRA